MIEVLGGKRVWLSINATFAERRLKIHIRYLLVSGKFLQSILPSAHRAVLQ